MTKTATAIICVACLGPGARVAFVPCGHVSYCQRCWTEVSQTPQHARSCPVCCAAGCALKLFYQSAPVEEEDEEKEPKQTQKKIARRSEDDGRETCMVELSTFLENLMLF